LKQSLFDAAKLWMRLATELDVTRRLLDEWGAAHSTIRSTTVCSSLWSGNGVCGESDQHLSVNNSDTPSRQVDDALTRNLVEGDGDPGTVNAKHQR
jgi:hypothetical protein